MSSRRDFIKTSATFTLGTYLLPQVANAANNVGVQLYSVRKEMLADAKGTLQMLAKLGYKELESARSIKGNYYGLAPKEIKKIAADLGMNIR
ncbi:MAG: sugar phosphate isomerase/epimerase family protein, partial [Segetibacter sp.]